MRVGVPKEIRGHRTPRRPRPGDDWSTGRGRRGDRRGGAGAAAGFSDDDYRRPARRSAIRGRPRSSPRWRRRPPTRYRSCVSGQALIAFLQPLTDRDGVERLARGRRARLRARVDPAHDAGPADGRALVAGDGRGLQGGADRRRPSSPLHAHADDRSRARSRPRRCSCSARGSRACRRSRPHGGSAASSPAFDVRPAVREQVESLGATFLDLGVVGAETEGGYARELTAEQQAAQQAELQARIPQFDAVITTAAIPGRRAPKLVTAEAVARDARRLGDRRPRGRDGRQLRADRARQRDRRAAA